MARTKMTARQVPVPKKTSKAPADPQPKKTKKTPAAKKTAPTTTVVDVVAPADIAEDLMPGEGPTKNDMGRVAIRFPRMRSYIRQHIGKSRRVEARAGIVLASFVDYILSEMIEQAASHALANHRSTIKNRDLFLSKTTDTELAKLLKDIIIPVSGVRQHLFASFVPHRLVVARERRAKATAKKLLDK